MNIQDYLDKNFLNAIQVIDWGYTEESIPLNFDKYKTWLKEKKHFPLMYLEGDRAEIRGDIKNYFPEFQSALVFLFSYEQVHRHLKQKYSQSFFHKIASYTLGFKGYDYHLILREALTEIAEKIKKDNPNLKYSLSIDMHPVLERDLALRAGLGWQGKNSMFINKNHGSFFIIGSLFINQKFEVKKNNIETDHCGQCRRCVDACPTEAIDIESRTINSKDCISTFTIEEFKLDTIPSPKMDLNSGFVFGCDICQTVCPWNIRVERIHKNETSTFAFNEKQNDLFQFFNRETDSIITELEEMSNNEYKNKFKGTSFERSGKRGLLKNFYFFKGHRK